MYCTNCKMVVDKDVNFCPCCGSRLVEETDEIRAEIERQEQEGAQYFGEGQYVEKRVMKSKTAGIIGYALGLLGVVIAYFKGDPEDPLVKFHINQSIVIRAAMLVLLALPLPILLKNITLYLGLGAEIYGIYEVVNNRMNGIPYINRLKFIK